MALKQVGKAPTGTTDSPRLGDLRPSFRNRIRNGNFGINQRVVSGTVTLAAGAYGHDGWKAGASGCTYTFATAANGDVTLTITAGTLVQAIEGGLYVPEGGAYVLSWTGTATARVYQGTATGTYAASPVAVTGLTAGTNTTTEFGIGTLALVEFEPGTAATVFERRDDEFRRCQRYFIKSYEPTAAPGSAPGNGNCNVNAVAPSAFAICDIVYPVQMRVAPTLTLYDGTGAAGKISYYDGAWKGGGAASAYFTRSGRLFVQANISGSVQINFEYVLSAEL